VVIIITKPNLTWFGRKAVIPKASRTGIGCRQEHSSDDIVVLDTDSISLRLFAGTTCDLRRVPLKIWKATYAPVRIIDRAKA